MNGSPKVVHIRPECIGCGACTAVAPDLWIMNEDGKADIKGCVSKKNAAGEVIEEVLEGIDVKVQVEAAQSCPVNCIHVFDESGKKLI